VPPLSRVALARVGRVSAGLLLALVAVVTAAAPAAAHAELRRTEPSNGAQLDDGPRTVEVEFTERVSADLGGLRVLDADGDRVDDGAVEVDGTVVRVGVEADLPDGSYVVSYRVISLDSHPIRGGFVFSVGDAVADPSLLEGALGSQGDRWLDWGASAARWVAYVGTLLAAGGALFLVVVHRGDDGRRALIRIVTAAAVVGALGILAVLPVQAAQATGRGLGSLFDAGVFTGIIGDGLGWAVLLGIAGLVLVVVGVRFDESIAGLGALVAAASFALTGHNRASDVEAVASAADVIHLWAAATWFGGLALLPFALRRLGPRAPLPRDLGAASGTVHAAAPDLDHEAQLEQAMVARHNRAIVARFSTVAAAAVVLVAVAGSVLTWAEVRSVDALVSTDYGALLVAKVGVVVLAVGLAVFNNRNLAPAVRSGRSPRAVISLRRVVAAEALLVVAALGLTAVLVNVTPARVAASGGVVDELVELGDVGSAQVVVDPARAGANVVHLYTFDPNGVPTRLGDEVTIETTMGDDLGPLRATAQPAGPSHFQVDDDLFPAAGTWQLTLRLRVDRFTEVSGSVDLDIAP
jgi:copper transport protein